MTTNNCFGKKLQQIRKAQGLTQEKLAELTGVHEKHISKLELGTYKPSFDTLNKIVKVLGMNINDINSSTNTLLGNADNPLYLKSIQILNNANEQELKFYYQLLKTCQKNISTLK